MLKGINNNDLSQQLTQTSGAEKTDAVNNSTNPYSKLDKNLLIDQLDISSTALKLYQKDKDIKAFTGLALSDPEDLSHNAKVAEKLLNGEVDTGEGNVLDELFSNQKFLKDLFG